jgi:hypothetical protein
MAIVDVIYGNKYIIRLYRGEDLIFERGGDIDLTLSEVYHPLSVRASSNFILSNYIDGGVLIEKIDVEPSEMEEIYNPINVRNSSNFVVDYDDEGPSFEVDTTPYVILDESQLSFLVSEDGQYRITNEN